jgi:dTDP-4-amino-4,6-dideoxygalactose transaminase
MIKFLDLRGQYDSIRNEIDAAIARVIDKAAFIGGEEVSAFEREFAGYLGAAHCVGVGNGTDALEISLEALGLPPGSEVIVPANSFIASSEAVTRAGLRVVFADVDPHTYTLDPDDVSRRVTPRTSAIVAVHLYGRPCEMDSLVTLAVRRRLALVEDCAQAHGAEYRGRRVGTFGRVGTFSFYPGKNLGAYGDGGAIVTDDAGLARRARMIANHGRVDKYNHEFEGRNSRLDAIQAAILRAKLPHLDAWVSTRNRVARAYLAELAGVGDLVLPELGEGLHHAFHLFVVRTAHRDALARHLAGAGIQTGVHYPVALPRLAAYGYLGTSDDTPIASAMADSVLSLPMGEHLREGDVAETGRAIREFFATRKR